MGEVQTSCCGDPELGGEPMCPASPAREAGRGCVLLDGTDFESQPASEKIGVSASGSGEQPSSPLHDVNGSSVEGQIESLVLEQALIGEALTTVADEENYGFPGLSPLRTVGVGGGYEAVLFSDDRDESAPFVSSGSDADCLLMAMRGNTAIQADELCCPPLLGECMAVPAGSEANRIKKRVGDQLFGLQTVQVSPLDHVGKWQEQSEPDACVASEGIGTCPLEIVEGEKQPSLQLETEAVRSVHSSPDKVVPSSAIEGPDSLHSSHVMTAMNYPSKLSSGVGNGTSTCCKPSPVIVFRRSNPKRAASLRNTPADRNPDQLARTIHGAKKHTKAVDTKTLILSRISNSLTRKRRFSCRPALRSVWGAVENLIKTFEQNDKFANWDRGAIRVQNKKTKKERSGLGKKRSKSQKGGNLRVSNSRSTTPSKSAHITHIKDQKPQNSLLHDVVDSQASVYPGVNGCLLKFDGKICVGFAKKGAEVEHKSLEQTRHARVKLLEHRMHRDKDLESTLTQDTSAENMPGEYPISSRSGTESLVETVDEKCLIDPGTSPDSDVYHPAMDVPITSACTTPTNQVAGMDPSALATETISHYSPNADFSTYSEAFVTHASVSPLDTQPLTNHKKGKKGKKNYIARGSLLSSSEHRFGERELNSPENLSKARKASKYSIPEWKKQEGCNERSPICAKSFRKATRKGPICNSFQVKSSVLGMSEFEHCEDSMKLAFDLENRVSSEWDDVNAQSEEGTLGGSLLTDKAKGIKLSRDTKARLSKGRSSHPDSVRHRRRNGHGKRKENVRKSCSKGGSKEKSGANHACTESSGGLSLALGVSSKLALTGATTLSSKINAGSKVVAEDIPSSVMLPICDEPASKEYCLGLQGQSLRPRAAWVLCDDCQKWRCIPAALADIIDETNCKWTCKDNKDKAFADCSIPQEKTNAEINAELEISDASGDEKSSRLQLNFKAIEPSKPAASQPASWTLIKSNIFLHRNRKSQTIDEIMVCHCKPPSDGSLGCGEECLNRMLNIECVRGTCPCGYLCSNQQFQKRKYSKFKWFRCGKKGFGLQLQEDVSPGQFLIEYVGEVLDFVAYEARQRDYASRGQKHFYFMTLNGGEVIDACIKGNLGRFINHSCVPNCRTEKWMVNGEVCIGLFAIRDIKKGEEVTFDYNYERVFGAAAKKCVCGSAECRGYIGGDPLNTEAIVQGDSDEEYPEPVMVCGDGERGLDRHGTVSDSIDAKVTNHKEIPIQMGDDDETVSDAIDPTVVKREEISIRTEDLSSKYPLTIPELEICPQREDTSSRPLSNDHLENLDPIQTEDTMDRPLSDTDVLDNSSHSSNSIQTEEIMCKPVSDVQPLEVSLGNSIAVNEYISDSVLHNKKLILSNVDDKLNISKPYPHTKSSRLKGTINKASSRAKSSAPHKAKKVPTDTSSGHFEGVEEKLNELLDEDGGISKRKDATKGYLKLLFVTAAEGDNIRGFACQSTRDLSLILDALLKTKSRMVLMDIINKNGLQMLHNIMKQNRSNFNRIPIIRKLLKVLEFLALKGILTLEHINRSPPCSGMESFKESILILTRHQDMQVHQIARNFRDKWIPRTSRRVEPSFKCWHDQGTRETDAIVRISEAVSIPRSSCESDITRGTSTLPCQQFYVSASLADFNPTSEGQTRKRKSRWDHPSDVSSDPQSLWSMKDQTVEAGSKLMKFTCSQLEQTSQQELVWQKSEMHKEDTSSCDEIPSLKNSMQQNVDDEAPPGFESPRKNHAQIPCRSLVVAGDVVMMDHPQKDDEAPPGFGSPQEDHHPQIPSKTSVVAGDVVMAHLQEKYLPHLTVSYGMPAALMQQLGASEAEGGNQCHPRWAVAPGMPFHPFPPLPLYTRGEPNPTAAGPTSSGHNVMTSRTKEETQLAKQCHTPPHLDLTDPRTSGERSTHMEAGARNPRIKDRVRWPSHGCGRRFVRPQRWHNQRFDRCWPPWPREGNGFRGSPNHGASNNCIGNTRRDNSEAYYFPEGVSSSNVGSNFHQPPRHD